ncbi:MAG: DNA polymerase [Acidobacteriaceae bacterium]
MTLLTLDWETFYDNEYSLSKMTTEAYVRDPRFEEILIGVKIDAVPAFWIHPERFAHFAANEVDWADTTVLAHHAHFDGLILAHHYNYRPIMWLDTLSMARAIDGPKAGNSLHELCERHGVGGKGDYVTYAKGKHRAEFTRDELRQYGEYCCNDCDRTYDLAQIFLEHFPPEQLRVIDRAIRMFTEPVLVGDVAKLDAAVIDERQRKIELLRHLGLTCPRCGGRGDDPVKDIIKGTIPCKDCDSQGVDKTRVRSNDQFAAVLRAAGVEPEMKDSPTGTGQIYAFAKTDPAMQSLLDHEDELVRALAEARLAVKSNIIETRAERFRDSASRGAMPVYLSPFAAHTLRMGGGDSMNWQNLSDRPEMSVLKASVSAPPGHKIARADSGQGEARITAWLAGQMDLVEAFAQGRDVYSEHASIVFGRPVDRKRVKEDHIPGQVGKVSILGMGYGMGWYKASAELLKGMLGAPPIQFTRADMETLHIDPSAFLNNPHKVAEVNAMPSRLDLTDRFIHCAVTEALVQRYRERYSRIPDYWQLMEHVITCMIAGEELTFGANGVMRTGHECIWLPNGMRLRYPGLERGVDGETTYWNGRKRTKLYGGLLTENTVQCLHYLIVSGQMLEISELLRVVLMTHDDVVAVVPEGAAEDALAFMIDTMKKAPSWAHGLPLTGEGGIGNTLREAK